MKNKNIEQQIINEYAAVTKYPSGDVWEKLEKSTNVVDTRNKKQRIFKPTKILATVASVMLIVGLVNIQTVIAFFSGLFFVPGIGLTNDDTISVYSINEPIKMETDVGTLTLQFMSKINRNDKSDLIFNIAADFPLGTHDMGVIINVGKELFDIAYHSGSGSVPGLPQKSDYNYAVVNFSDANEFDLTIRGVTTRIILEEHNNNYALSKENNGITLLLHKFPGIDSFIGVDIYDSKIENQYDYFTTVQLRYPEFDGFFDENDNEIETAGGGSSGFGDDLRITIINTKGNASEIKRLKADGIQINYSARYNEPVIKIPIPADGETVEPQNCQVTIAGHTYKITEIRRDGDTLWYKDNRQRIWYNQEHQETIENNNSSVSGVFFVPTAEVKSGNFVEEWGSFTGFDTNAKTIEVPVWRITVIQLGDFDIEFD